MLPEPFNNIPGAIFIIALLLFIFMGLLHAFHQWIDLQKSTLVVHQGEVVGKIYVPEETRVVDFTKLLTEEKFMLSVVDGDGELFTIVVPYETFYDVKEHDHVNFHTRVGGLTGKQLDIALMDYSKV